MLKPFTCFVSLMKFCLYIYMSIYPFYMTFTHCFWIEYQPIQIFHSKPIMIHCPNVIFFISFFLQYPKLHGNQGMGRLPDDTTGARVRVRSLRYKIYWLYGQILKSLGLHRMFSSSTGWFSYIKSNRPFHDLTNSTTKIHSAL